MNEIQLFIEQVDKKIKRGLRQLIYSDILIQCQLILCLMMFMYVYLIITFITSNFIIFLLLSLVGFFVLKRIQPYIIKFFGKYYWKILKLKVLRRNFLSIMFLKYLLFLASCLFLGKSTMNI